jgi:predicted lipid-binding transport protein (Tim44 family)
MLPNPDEIKTEEDRIRARNQCIALHTVGGALGGALIGGLIGGDWKGAGIGAAIGGGIGFAYAWGKCLSLYSTLKSQPAAGYQETAQKIGYNSPRETSSRSRASTRARHPSPRAVQSSLTAPIMSWHLRTARR